MYRREVSLSAESESYLLLSFFVGVDAHIDPFEILNVT